MSLDIEELVGTHCALDEAAVFYLVGPWTVGVGGGGIIFAGITRREEEQAENDSKDESKEETSECPTAESHRRGKGVNHTWKRFNRKLGT